MSNNSIWPIDTILSGATTPSQSGPGSNGNEGVVHIPQSSSIPGASSSDCLMSYPGHLVEGGGFTPLQRCSRYILQPQPTGLPGALGDVEYSFIAITPRSTLTQSSSTC